MPSLWDKWNADVALGWTPDEHTVVELAIGRGDGETRMRGAAWMDRFERHFDVREIRLDGALEKIEARHATKSIT